LVPKQMSTGDRTILGGITKRGNRYLRMLFMQAARVVLLRPGNWMNHGFGPGSPTQLNGCTIMCWPPLSPTSSPASHGASLQKIAYTKHASEHQRLELSLWFTKGMMAIPLRHRYSLVRRASDGGSEG